MPLYNEYNLIAAVRLHKVHSLEWDHARTHRPSISVGLALAVCLYWVTKIVQLHFDMCASFSEITHLRR